MQANTGPVPARVDANVRRRLSLVVPCHNEAAGLEAFLARLDAVLDQLTGYDCEVICVDDGSTDTTPGLLAGQVPIRPRLLVLELSRNFGKEAALTAGIEAARGDAVVPIDADLQHPPELIIEMVRLWEGGAEMVLARRRSRDTEGLLQRSTAAGFYRLHNWLADFEIPRDVGDFRLMDRQVVEALLQLPERRRFMKGLFTWVGFRSQVVEFDVAPRSSGRSSFHARARWSLALEGITSFSTFPLRVWSWVGIAVAAMALVYGAWIVLRTLIHGADIPGFASLLTAVLLLGGIQLISIGVLGEYLGRIYSEVKQRPLYVVRRRYGRAGDA